MQDKSLGTAIKWGVIIFVLVILFFGSFGTIGAGERGVKTRLGAVVGPVDQGVYFKLPFIEKVTTMNVRTISVVYEKENPLTSASKDLQDVNIATVVNYHIDPTKVVDIYVQYKDQEYFEEQAIRPVVRDAVKAVASQYTAEELVTKRNEYGAAVLNQLNTRLAEKYVVVEQSNITNFEFSPAFTASTEKKVTAVQNAEAAKNELERVKYEAQQTIEVAKAQAESIKIQSQAVAAQGGSDYVQLQAIKQWNGVLPSQMVPNASVPFLNLGR